MSNTNNKAVLSVRSLAKNFGGILALSGMELDIYQGEIVSLIGPNGAGKTTFFNCVTGIYTPSNGTIVTNKPARGNANPLNDKSLVGLKPYEITELGFARTFQNIRLFPTMTVLENVMVGRHCRTNSGILGALFHTKSTVHEDQNSADRAYELLKELNLQHLWKEEARNLPYGAQRRLEIARALATEPYLLFLDEPAAGMNPQETQELKDLIVDIRDRFRLSILLIEHDMGMVMSLSDRLYVMEYGALIAQGLPEEIRTNPAVIKAYLGEDA